MTTLKTMWLIGNLTCNGYQTTFWYARVSGGRNLNSALNSVIRSIQNSYPTKPQVRHFRSTNMYKIEKELEDNWLEIIEKNIIIPTHQILEENEENTKVIVKSTQFLQPYPSRSSKKFQRNSQHFFRSTPI